MDHDFLQFCRSHLCDGGVCSKDGITEGAMWSLEYIDACCGTALRGDSPMKSSCTLCRIDFWRNPCCRNFLSIDFQLHLLLVGLVGWVTGFEKSLEEYSPNSITVECWADQIMPSHPCLCGAPKPDLTTDRPYITLAISEYPANLSWR